jgi:hypothetical protein
LSARWLSRNALTLRSLGNLDRSNEIQQQHCLADQSRACRAPTGAVQADRISPDRWSIMLEVLEPVKRTVPTNDERPPEEISGVMKEALLAVES